MSSKRAIAILVLVGGLSILTVQNLSPALPLVFLGVRLPTLPLSLWMLIAIATGALTAIILSSFSKVSPTPSRHRTSPPPPDPPKPPVEPSGFAGASEWKSGDSEDSEEWISSPPPTPPEPPQSEEKAGKSDDWETEVRKVGPNWDDGNWVDTGDAEPESPPRSSENWTDPSQEPFNPHHTGKEWGNETAPEEPEPAPSNYETQQVPNKESWSGSVYSFGYRNSEESGVGRPESVFDADYRLITPLGSQPTQIQSDSEDSEFEDDDLEGETPPRRN
ncbi:MAG: LapA family protein [Limnospira sp.]